MSELARRAVACRHWRWMPGMLTEHGRVCGAGYLVSDDVDEVGQPFVDCTDTTEDWPSLLPDLDDWGTLGCLLGLVRLARMDPHWLPTCLDWEGGLAWVIEPPSRDRQTRHGSYAAVLVAALEAAP